MGDFKLVYEEKNNFNSFADPQLCTCVFPSSKDIQVAYVFEIANA